MAFAGYLKNEEKSENTIEKYIRVIRTFAEYIGDSEITKETVIEYKRQLQEKYKVCSVNSVLASLNSFFGFVGWYELKVKTIKLQKQIYCSEEKELTRAECERLLVTARENGNFARTYYSLKRDIARLADILGHSSIETTRIYTMETGDVHRRQIERLGCRCAEK